MLDCAASKVRDPNPNNPADLARLFAGSGKVLQIRCGNTLEEVERIITHAARPDVRLVIKFGWPENVAAATAIYRQATQKLEEIYANGGS
jgi:hypothetical protein